MLEGMILSEMMQNPANDLSSDVSMHTRALNSQARVAYREVIQHFRATGDSGMIGLALNMLGLHEYYAANYAAAIPLLRESEKRQRELGNRAYLALALNNLALVALDSADYAEATRLTREARDQLDPLIDAQSYADRTHNIAAARLSAGDWDGALQDFLASLSLQQKLQNSLEEGRSRHGIGIVYALVGDVKQAEAYLKQARGLRDSKTDPPGYALTLRALASIASSNGQRALALRYLDEALIKVQEGTVRSYVKLQRIELLRELGRVGEAAAALTEFEQSAADRSPPATAIAKLLRARIEEDRGLTAETPRFYEAAIEALKVYPLSAQLTQAYVGLSRVKERAGNWAAALGAMDEAINVAERVRGAVDSPDLRVTAAAPLQQLVDRKLRVLLRAQALRALDEPEVARAAVFAMERARARAIQDWTRRAEPAPEASNNDRLRAARTQSYADKQARWSERVQQWGADDVHSRRLAAELADLASQIAAQPSGLRRRGGAVQLEAWVPRLSRLDDSEVILSYWMGSARDVAVVAILERGGVTLRTLGRSGDLETLARAVYASARDPTASPAAQRESLRALSTVMLGPVADKLEGRRRLTVVPAGALASIPIAALPWPNGPADRRVLVDRFDVAIAPAVRFALDRDSGRASLSPRDAILAIADPIYGQDDPRVITNSRTRKPVLASTVYRGETFTRLPSSNSEASAVRTFGGTNRVRVLAGPEATRTALLATDLSQYRVIHVAAHAVIDPQMPMLSSLVLSSFDQSGNRLQDRIRSADLTRVRLNSDLVFLSACETALGKQMPGEGVIGLSSAFLERGSRHVVATLWRVSDLDSSRLVTRFYRQYAQVNDPVAALSAAMRDERRARPNAPAFSWAPFIAILGPPRDASASGAPRR
jgi:CHAT domain-containing protein